jgi:hypothetical protein
MELKVALSRPACWTIELQKGMVADYGIFLMGTKGLNELTVSSACNRLPLSVAILIKAWRESGSALR